MQADGGQIIVNPTFQDWVFENEKSPQALQTPMKRQITYRVEEEIGPKETKNDPWEQNDYHSKVDYGGATYASNGGCSRPGVVIFTIVICLESIAALVLILLMWFGKMGEGCGCSTSGAPSGSLSTGIQKDILTRITDLERNVTILRQGLEDKTNELKVVDSSLRDLDEKLLNLTMKLNITEVNLKEKDNMLHALLKNTTSSILHKIDSVNDDLNSTRNQLIVSEHEIRNELGVLNTTLILKITTDFQILRTDLNTTRTYLEDADTEVQKSLKVQNSTLTARMDSLKNDLNSTRNQLIASDTYIKNKLETVNTTLDLKITTDFQVLRMDLNSTRNNLEDANAELQKSLTAQNASLTTRLIDATDRLNQEDVRLRTLLSEFNTTLSNKIENVSKLQGPIGPHGFNGSQGPIGLAGLRGFNGTQGPLGMIGPQGFNGSQGPPGPQGPKGAGDFSLCKHKTADSTATQDVISSNVLPNPVKVIQGEPSGKKIVGVSCTINRTQLYLLTSEINPHDGQLFYTCRCYGHHGTGQVDVQCTMHYWECPLTA